MTAVSSVAYVTGWRHATGSSAASEPASRLKAHATRAYHHYAKTGFELIEQQIAEVRATCADQGWDGYSARPIEAITVEQAMRFALALPRNLPVPDIVAEPDGEIAFDWAGSDGRVISVSIGPTGTLAYAALLSEHSRQNGSEQLGEAIPPRVIRAIQEAVL